MYVPAVVTVMLCVVAPLDHVFPVVALDVNVILALPGQSTVDDGVMVGVVTVVTFSCKLTTLKQLSFFTLT